ncbi:SDR family NAD(P)-dependent oxidoreductase [Ideonella sp. YS5]|uniref:SDR family NAD(P)-dependent oxidoreductase n=1 Tax=Ideonella sp. YS5 TaxID=3453714 RepID=UPI003EE8E549
MIRHAFITGASRGIGAAVARALAEDGWRLTLTGREAPTALAAELDAFAVAMDQTDADSVGAAFVAARLAQGPVMALVNNAGAVQTAPFGKTTPELWQRMLDVNLSGPFRCCHAALPDIVAAGAHGRIVNIASTAALKGYAYVSAYVAAKHGVLGLTRSLALELAKSGATANAVCPGYTETDIVREGIANVMSKTGRSEAEARAGFTQSNPQGRLVQPEEVASAVRWLCSAGAASVNGQAIAVCGGETT